MNKLTQLSNAEILAKLRYNKFKLVNQLSLEVESKEIQKSRIVNLATYTKTLKDLLFALVL